jgi:hypothetical protein
MTARIACLVTLLVATLASADALAQGRGRGGDQGRGRGGDNGDRGPAFCRSGEGHPVFGWEWCERQGWGRVRGGSFPRTYPDARDPYPETRRYPSPNGDRVPDATTRNGGIAFDNGYADGYEKGLDDGRDRRAYDPVRHQWYRQGDRGYDSRYGSRAQYQNVYRDGFRSGYEAGYCEGELADRSGGIRLPWPFLRFVVVRGRT